MTGPELSSPRRKLSSIRVLGFAATHFFFNFVFGALALAWSTAFKSTASNPKFLDVLLVILNPLGWLFDRLLPDSEFGIFVLLLPLVSSGILYGVAFSWLFPGSEGGGEVACASERSGTPF